MTDWQAIGKYHGMDEFVESIPFTETRDYVQAILRNESIYRELNQQHATPHETSKEHEAARREASAPPAAPSSTTVAQQKAVAEHP